MARGKKSKRKKERRDTALLDGVREETLHGVYAVVLFAASIFFLLAPLGKGGVVGDWLFQNVGLFLGVGYFLLPALTIILGISYVRSVERSIGFARTIAVVLFLVAGLGIIEILFAERAGVLGYVVTAPLTALFGITATFVFLVAAFSIALLILFNTDLTTAGGLRALFNTLTRKKSAPDDAESLTHSTSTASEHTTDTEKREEAPTPTEDVEPEAAPKKESPKKWFRIGDSSMPLREVVQQGTYEPPPLNLLTKTSGKPGVGDIKANTNIIKRTLANFGITVEMDEVSIGPTVTRYALKPAEGVKLSRILGLKNDLALALAAHPIRIEAPIPGKSLVGIEIPNTAKATIGLASLLAQPEYTEADKPLVVALGKGVSGISFFADIAKMPHLLIAGATGSGKSVTIHTLVTSLLFRNAPEHLRLIMIDPKRVELTLYNSIPHLLTPVITQAKQAILALKWATQEMDRRYNILESHKVRDVQSYHENIFAPALKQKTKGRKEVREEDIEDDDMPERMPYIVVIIDELADIMTAYPRELEAGIVRLAQMSRAVGIHLILSTQRPSVNVITGLIKANIPARIALQVSSQVDSRTILDTSGAEALLGAGDMLYLSGEMSKPQRIQSAYINERDVKRIVEHLAEQADPSILNEISLSADSPNAIFSSSSEDTDMQEEDELYEEARETVIQAKKASTSLLQRKLRIGYSRAARLIDMLEERGVVGPAEGSKPRAILANSNFEEDTENTEDEEDYA